MNIFVLRTAGWQKVGAMFIAFALLMTAWPAATAQAVVIDDEGDKKVTICQATASESNPFNENNVNKNSIVTGNGELKGGVNVNSIIPPFGNFPGLNWDDEGQAIYNNDCNKVTNSDPEPEPEPTATLVATKIICTDESEMPQWGNGGQDIDATTAQSWVDENGSCDFAAGWEFEWAPSGTSNPDNDLPANPLYGAAGGSWNTFGPTDAAGETTISIPLANLGSSLWVREVLQDGYIPFTFGPNNQTNTFPSAEIYCHTDGLNYDNYDRVDGLTDGQTYYCVAWNMPKAPELTECTFTMKSDELDYVVEKNAAAEELSTIHPSWIANIGSSIAAWIWGDDPVAEPTTDDETQTFQKGFNWTGASIDSATLTIASDNSHAITLGTFTGGDAGEFNYSASQDYDVSSGVVSGYNLLEVAVKNFALANSNPTNNPAGLIYELTIVGQHKDENCGEVVPVEPEVPVEPSITINATKIICENADLLPQGSGGWMPITADTAADFLDSSEAREAGCHINSDWEFQWIGEAVLSAQTDQMAGALGDWSDPFIGSVTIPMSELGSSPHVSLREVFQPGYIPFSRHNSEVEGNLPSAEFYCATDGKNFDNMEWITNPVEGEEYYCVAWNVPVEKEEPKDTITVCKLDDEQNPLAGWNMTVSLPMLVAPSFEGESNGEFMSVLELDREFLIGDIIELPEPMTGTTGEGGCVTFSVPAGSGPWLVEEEMQAGWEFVSASAGGPASYVEGETCVHNDYYDPKKILVIEEESVNYNCTFVNKLEDDEEVNGGDPTPTVSGTSRRVSGNAGNMPQAPTPQVLGATTEATQCGPLLTTHMKMGVENDMMEVYKLQAFLIALGYGDASMMTGTFDSETDQAVRAFQLEYQDEVLTPWMEAGIVPHNNPTGWVYRTTKWKINNIYCPESEEWPGLL